MADDDGTTVEVDETTVEAPDAVVEASPTIIVETGDDGDDDTAAEVAEAREDEHRLTVLEQTVAGLVSVVEELNARASTTEAVQEATVEAVVETAEVVEAQGAALDETIEEDIPEEVGEEKDEAPTSAREHWFFRPWKRRN